MDENIKKTVRESYAVIATQNGSCCDAGNSCCDAANSCCGSNDVLVASKAIGYSDTDLNSVPEGANLGLGCGNPVAIASLREGEVVLDLGSGGGFDCFLSANAVGRSGKVIGIDMTPEMISLAGENAEKGGYENVEFRLGEIEDLPVDDAAVDIIISNCVINLSPEKRKVFEEAFRVLKPGGRIMVSDIVLLGELPETVRDSVDAYVSCIAGAVSKDEYIAHIQKAGFKDIRIIDETGFSIEYTAPADDSGPDVPVGMVNRVLSDVIASMKISAVKPAEQ
jgi:arsenite methyltransferase